MNTSLAAKPVGTENELLYWYDAVLLGKVLIAIEELLLNNYDRV